MKFVSNPDFDPWEIYERKYSNNIDYQFPIVLYDSKFPSYFLNAKGYHCDIYSQTKK